METFKIEDLRSDINWNDVESLVRDFMLIELNHGAIKAIPCRGEGGFIPYADNYGGLEGRTLTKKGNWYISIFKLASFNSFKVFFYEYDSKHNLKYDFSYNIEFNTIKDLENEFKNLANDYRIINFKRGQNE